MRIGNSTEMDEDLIAKQLASLIENTGKPVYKVPGGANRRKSSQRESKESNKTEKLKRIIKNNKRYWKDAYVEDVT